MPYHSCIKINGRRILPPLIDSSYRQELLIYKQQAISIEAKLQQKKLCEDGQANFIKKHAILHSNNLLFADTENTTNITYCGPQDIKITSRTSTPFYNSSLGKGDTLPVQKCITCNCGNNAVPGSSFDQIYSCNDDDAEVDSVSSLDFESGAFPVPQSTSRESLSKNVPYEENIHKLKSDVETSNSISLHLNEEVTILESPIVHSECMEDKMVEENLEQVIWKDVKASEKKIVQEILTNTACRKSMSSPANGTFDIEKSISYPNCFVQSLIADDLTCSLKLDVSRLPGLVLEHNREFGDNTNISENYENLSTCCDIPLPNLKENIEDTSLKENVTLNKCVSSFDQQVAKSFHNEYLEKTKNDHLCNFKEINCTDENINLPDESSHAQFTDILSNFSSIGTIIVNTSMPEDMNPNNYNSAKGESWEECSLSIEKGQTLSVDMVSSENEIHSEYLTSKPNDSQTFGTSTVSLSCFETSNETISASQISSTLLENVSVKSESIEIDSSEDGFSQRNVLPAPLVRQNSYTLDSPSPALLAHIESQKKIAVSASQETNSRKEWNFPCTTCKDDDPVGNIVIAASDNIVKAVRGGSRCNTPKKSIPRRKEVSSLPTSVVSSPIKQDSYFGSENCLHTLEYKLNPRSAPPNRKAKILNKLLRKIHPVKNSPKAAFANKAPKYHFEQCSNGSLVDYHPNNNVNKIQKISQGLTTSQKLQNLFYQLQQKHSQMMADLLSKQKQEQEEMKRAFETQQKLLLLELSNKKSCSPHSVLKLDEKVSEVFVVAEKDLNLHSFNKRSSCSRVLFPSTAVTPNMHEAATVINAAVRGYLVRRLMKTERVQHLINVIKDTLECAIKLKQDCAIKVEPADVDLQRKLIQQLTSACYSFHDTFFKLSLTEKMSVIASDRERLRSLKKKQIVQGPFLSYGTKKSIERKKSLNTTSTSLPSSRKSARSLWSRSSTCSMIDSGCSTSRKSSPSSSHTLRTVEGKSRKLPWR